MKIFRISLVFLFSLVTRLWLAPKLDFGVDQQAIYQIGKTFYETGMIPAEGPKLVYTGESIPGGFQAVMAGIPLFFSQGEAIGLQFWVVVLNWLSMLLMFLWLRPKLKETQETTLSVFLAFSPWSLLFSPAWNPSFLPVFAVPFFWLLEKGRAKDSFWLGLLFILCLQLHLSAVLLGLAVLIAFPSVQNKAKFIVSAGVGAISGGLFLVPWLLKKMEGSVSAPIGVIGFHFENVLDIPKAFFRYLTFPTAEVSRFIAPQGHGFQGMLEMLKSAPLLWLPAVISFAGSLVMVGWFLKYWFSLRRGQETTFSRVEFLLPLLMTLTFLFSIKGASAHTFWILMPLSFYSMVKALEQKNTSKLIQGIYLVSSLVLVLYFYL